MQAYIMHCPALRNATPQLMRKLSAMVFNSYDEAIEYLNDALGAPFELLALDSFRELWNSPECCTLFPDASFIANIYVKSNQTDSE
mgnify:CR=1 FL=1